MFKKITSFTDELTLNNGLEKKLFNDIKNNEIKYFYLEDYGKKANTKLFLARRELIRQGILIPVLVSDIVKLCPFGTVTATPWCISLIEDLRPGKLINCTYQGHRVPLKKKYPTVRDEYVWKEVWVDSYNDWIDEYLPRIISFI